VRVPVPSAADLDELYRIRTLLECEALTLAIEHGDDLWESQIIAACYRLERAPLPQARERAERGTTVVEWETRHRDFHAALIAAAPAPRLIKLIDQMVDQTERYRAIRLVQGDNTRLVRDVAAEHRALCDATVARDKRAVTLLAEHLERTRRFVSDLLRQRQPD
jgi:GntR family transcriptional regulator, carbon starvation induced regulator